MNHQAVYMYVYVTVAQSQNVYLRTYTYMLTVCPILTSLQPPEALRLTNYTVNFGDSSPEETLNGPAAINHTYQDPAKYELSVVSTNIAGVRTTSMIVYVRGKCTSSVGAYLVSLTSIRMHAHCTYIHVYLHQ